MENKTLLDRYRGAMFGLAVGDALGTTLENQRPPKETLKEIVGGGPFQLLPGEWTDGNFHQKMIFLKVIFRYINFIVTC